MSTLDKRNTHILGRNRVRDGNENFEQPSSRATPFYRHGGAGQHIYSTPRKPALGKQVRAGANENAAPFIPGRCSFSSALLPMKSEVAMMSTPQKEDQRPEAEYHRLLENFNDITELSKRVDVALRIASLAKERQKFMIAQTMLRCVLHLSPYRVSTWLELIKLLEDQGHFESAMFTSIHALSFCGNDDAVLLKAMKLSERQNRLDLARHALFVSRSSQPQKQLFFLLEGAKLEARIGNHHIVKNIYNYVLGNISALSTCGGNAFVDAAQYEIGKMNLSASVSTILRGIGHSPKHAPLLTLLQEVQSVLSQTKLRTLERAVQSGEEALTEDIVMNNAFYYEKEAHLCIGYCEHLSLIHNDSLNTCISSLQGERPLSYYSEQDCLQTLDALSHLELSRSEIKNVMQGHTTWQANLAQHLHQCEYIRQVHHLSPKHSFQCGDSGVESNALLIINGCTCGSMREYQDTKTTHANLEEVKAQKHAEFCFVTVQLRNNDFHRRFSRLTEAVAPIVPPLAFLSNERTNNETLPKELLRLEFFSLIPKQSQFHYLPENTLFQEQENLTNSAFRNLQSHHNTEQEWRIHLSVQNLATSSRNIELMRTASMHALSSCASTLQWKVHLTTSKKKLELMQEMFKSCQMNIVTLLQRDMLVSLTGQSSNDVLGALAECGAPAIQDYQSRKQHVQSFMTISSEQTSMMPVLFGQLDEAEASSEAACSCVSKRSRGQVMLVNVKTRLFGGYFRSILSGICVYQENIKVARNLFPIFTYQQAFAAAQESSEKLILSCPGEWRAHVEQSSLFIQQGMYTRAMTVLQDSLLDCPTNGRILASLIAFHRHSDKDTILSVLEQAFKDSPKSGEIWCEGARLFLDPTSDLFDLYIATTMLRFAIHFTPQYGDSFIELLKCRLLRYDVGSDILDLAHLKQQCVNSDPNYGTLWLECKYMTLSKTAGETFDLSRLLILEEITKNKELYQIALLRSQNVQNSGTSAARIDTLEQNRLLRSPDVTRASVLSSSRKKKTKNKVDCSLTEEIKKELLGEMDSADVDEVVVRPDVDSEDEEDKPSSQDPTGGLFSDDFDEEDWTVHVTHRDGKEASSRSMRETWLGERCNAFQIPSLARQLLPVFDVDLLFPASKRMATLKYKDVDLFLNTVSNFQTISVHLWKHSFDLDDGILH